MYFDIMSCRCHSFFPQKQFSTTKTSSVFFFTSFFWPELSEAISFWVSSTHKNNFFWVLMDFIWVKYSNTPLICSTENGHYFLSRTQPHPWAMMRTKHWQPSYGVLCANNLIYSYIYIYIYIYSFYGSLSSRQRLLCPISRKSILPVVV